MKLGKLTIRPLDALYLLVPLAIIGEHQHWNKTVLFVISALGVIPLAGLMGQATEALAHHVGPRLGGLLNATLGNAAELIITIMAIRAGLMELVLASITGSVIGNLLLVLGLAVLLGGIKNGRQRFDPHLAGVNSTMLLVGLAGLAVPALFIHAMDPATVLPIEPEGISLGAAALLILIYALNIFYNFTLETGADPLQVEEAAAPGTVPAAVADHAPWSVPVALGGLLLATVGIAWLSEVLVGAVEHASEALHLSEFFIGIIVVPLVGNVAEHLVAVQTALKNKMELSMAISLGSSLQIALFVAPLLVFISLAMGHPLQLNFHPLELVSLLVASLIAAFIAQDGETNWLEGAMLLVLYALLAVGFFFLRHPAAIPVVTM